MDRTRELLERARGGGSELYPVGHERALGLKSLLERLPGDASGLLQGTIDRLIIKPVLQFPANPAINHQAIQKILLSAPRKGLKGGPENLGRSL